jgi:hypothetical protein
VKDDLKSHSLALQPQAAIHHGKPPGVLIVVYEKRRELIAQFMARLGMACEEKNLKHSWHKYYCRQPVRGRRPRALQNLALESKSSFQHVL